MAPAWPAQALAAAAVLLALAIGLEFPDLDQQLPLGHRSGLTHGAWAPLLLAAWQRLRLVAGGLAGGIAVHLGADLFPAAMTGYATIKLPLAGSLGLWSYLWIALHAAAALALAAWLLRPLLRPGIVPAAAGLFAILMALAYLARDKAALPALLLAAGLAWTAVRAVPACKRLRDGPPPAP